MLRSQGPELQASSGGEGVSLTIITNRPVNRSSSSSSPAAMNYNLEHVSSPVTIHPSSVPAFCGRKPLPRSRTAAAAAPNPCEFRLGPCGRPTLPSKAKAFPLSHSHYVGCRTHPAAIRKISRRPASLKNSSQRVRSYPLVAVCRE